MRQELIWRGVQVTEKLERETGLEPATSSLGSRVSFESTELRRFRRRTACTQSQEFAALPEFCSKNYSKDVEPSAPYSAHQFFINVPASSLNSLLEQMGWFDARRRPLLPLAH